MRILFLGDIVGEPGRRAVINHLKDIKAEEGVDFVIANGENSAGGRGITKKITLDLLRSGIEVITTGDHVWDQKETIDFIANEQRLLRPINFTNAPGEGTVVIETEQGPIGVVNGLGRTFINALVENPFTLIAAEVERIREKFPSAVILVDFHAEATSEKIAMGRHLDGRASAVVGTHTHVQTADERVFPGGTAFITDVGMCGPDDSILGRAIDSVLYRFRTGLPTRFPVAKAPVRLSGVLIDFDSTSGMASQIRRFSKLITNLAHA